MTTLTASDLKLGLTAISDAATAYKAGLGNIGDDEQVAFDIIKFAAPLVGGAFGSVAPIVGPLVIEALVLAMENNQSATEGSLTRIASGARGSAEGAEQQDIGD